MPKFHSVNDALLYVKETLIVDLTQHIGALICSNVFPDALAPAEEGIYRRNGIRTVFTVGQDRYLESVYRSKNRKPIQSLDEFLNANENIVDRNGTKVFSKRELMLQKSQFTKEPCFTSQLSKIVLVIIQKYFEDLYEHGELHYPETFNIYKILRPEYHYLFDGEFLLPLLKDLIDKLDAFVKDDDWHIYRAKLLNNTLIISKTVDWRVYDYYQRLETIDPAPPKSIYEASDEEISRL